MKNLLLTSPSNIRYLSNFTGSKAVILKLPNKTYFFTDSRYFEEAKKIIPPIFNLQIYKKGEFKDEWQKILKKHRLKEIHFEANHLTYSALKYWRKISRPVKLKPQTGEIEKLRTKKSAQEIRLLKKSQQINEQVFYTVKKHLKTGITEKEIAWKIQETAHKLGCDELAFPPIVAFGKSTSIPHHKTGPGKLKKGDMILIDMGVKYKGMCSDMTRTLFTAKPTSEQEKAYQTVLQAQKNAIRKLKPGITGHKAWQLAAKIIDSEYFTHGLGHGIGLDIHESPSLAEKSKSKIKEGMVMTVEPGLYLPNKFGIRIEDMGVLRDKFENFTKAQKELKDCIVEV